MGDLRFAHSYERLRKSPEPASELHALKDGEVIEALAHASRIHDPYAANILATEALNRLSERQRWLDLVETFYDVHDQLGIGLLIVDSQRASFANEAFRDIVGLSLDELVDRANLLDLVVEEDREAIASEFKAIIGKRRPNRPRRTTLLCSDGTSIPVEVLVATAPDHAGDGGPRLVCVVRKLPKD